MHADLELEKIAIGALLDAEQFGSDAAEQLLATALTEEDFTGALPRAAFAAIRELGARRQHASSASVWALIHGQFEAPTAHVVEQWQATNTAAPAALATAAEELRKLSRLREFRRHYESQIATLGEATPVPATMLAADETFARAMLGAVAGDGRGDADVYELQEQWDAFDRGERTPFLTTGVARLDEIFNGFVPNLNLIGGRASVGKTALVAEMIWQWVHGGQRIGVFGLEDGTQWLVRRHLARALNIPLGAVAATRLDNARAETMQHRLGEWTPVLHENLLTYRRSGIAAADLVAIAKKWIHVDKVRAIVIDHGGEIRQGGDERQRNDLRIKATMEGLRDLAVNTRTPIIVLWHLNREGARAGRPTMESFKESGYLEAMARTMLGLWERDADPDHMLITVVKQTEGRRDRTVAIPRDCEHALLHADGGRLLDLQAEAAAETAPHPKPKGRKLYGNEGER